MKMTRLIFGVLAVLAMLLCAGCKPDEVVATGKTGLNLAVAGEGAVIAVLHAKHNAGTLSDERWAKIQIFDVRFQALVSSANFALIEYNRLRDKTTAERFVQLVADLGDIVTQINELVQSWKDPDLEKSDGLRQLREAEKLKPKLAALAPEKKY